MKKVFLWMFLILTMIAVHAGVVSAGDAKERYTIMHPDRETRQRWIQDYENAPRAYIDKDLRFSIPLKGSLSLLSHLEYTPSERDQGSCGNCWVWAGTGIMEVAFSVNKGIHDRLSVQYVNSCSGMWSNYACCGGNLSDFVDFYEGSGHAIPWSNTNAGWQDGSRDCGSGLSAVSCSSISISPGYNIAHMEEQTIETQGVGQAQAVSNIKNVLNQGRAVWLGFYLATQDDWYNLFNFWNNNGESAIWNPDYSCEHIWDDGGGGHTVLCVGYNDNDPDNSYWILVNSWGTAGGKRPNGILRINMNMNYDCTFYDGGSRYWSFYWQTLEMEYGSSSSGPIVTTDSATSVTSNSATLNGTVNPNGVSTTYYFEYGTTESYGSDTATKSAGSGTANISVNANITGLSPGTTYHYRIVAVNSAGTSYGSNLTFNTAASILSPIVTTDSATSVTSDSATLNGTVNPNCAAAKYHFEYGTTTIYGSSTKDRFAGSGAYNLSVSASIKGLSPNTVYHYRIVAMNSAGISYGGDRAFITEKKDTSWIEKLLLED